MQLGFQVAVKMLSCLGEDMRCFVLVNFVKKNMKPFSNLLGSNVFRRTLGQQWTTLLALKLGETCWDCMLDQVLPVKALCLDWELGHGQVTMKVGKHTNPVVVQRVFLQHLGIICLVSQSKTPHPLIQVSGGSAATGNPAESLLRELISALGSNSSNRVPHGSKVKEAETLRFPEFPTPEKYRSWRTAVREEIRAASDRPDEAWTWLLKVYEEREDKKNHMAEPPVTSIKLLRNFIKLPFLPITFSFGFTLIFSTFGV